MRRATTYVDGRPAAHPHESPTWGEVTTAPTGVLRVPEGNLRYWRHLGAGPRSFKLGRYVRYWRADLVLWLSEQTNRPQERS